MEKHLATHDSVAADRYTIADMALYATPTSRISATTICKAFPAIRAGWLSRRRRAGHVTMEHNPAAALPAL